jgi:hypothetical protein
MTTQTDISSDTETRWEDTIRCYKPEVLLIAKGSGDPR